MTQTQKVIDRRAKIVGAAKKVFLERGYELASMDQIAAEAGTTKRTVYAYFKNKQALFSAMAEMAARNFLEMLGKPDHEARDYRRELERFADRFCMLSTLRSAVLFQRIMIAESERFPEISPQASAGISGKALETLADYLHGLRRRGAITTADPRAAAVQFLDMTSGSIRMATLFGALPSLPNSLVDIKRPSKYMAQIRRSVDLFLRGTATTRGRAERGSPKSR